MPNRRIEDRNSLEAWLSGQPRETAMVVAARAALRVAPFAWDWAQGQPEGDRLTLALCRTLLRVGVAVARPGPEARTATSDALAAVPRPPPDADHAARAMESAEFTARTCLAAENEVRATAADAAEKASQACRAHEMQDLPEEQRDGLAANVMTASKDFWEAVQDDCHLIEAGNEPFLQPLWPLGAPHSPPPSPLRRWRARGGDWTFWADWFEGYLTGRPLDQNLLERIALISSTDLSENGGDLNGTLGQIYQGYRIGAEAARLEADLVRAISEEVGLGHNNPPGPVDDFPLVVPAIQEPLRAIRSQWQVPKQNGPVLDDALRRLGETIALAARYAGAQTDVAITGFAKAFGETLGRATARVLLIWLLSNLEPLRTLIELAGELRR